MATLLGIPLGHRLIVREVKALPFGAAVLAHEVGGEFREYCAASVVHHLQTALSVPHLAILEVVLLLLRQSPTFAVPDSELHIPFPHHFVGDPLDHLRHLLFHGSVPPGLLLDVILQNAGQILLVKHGPHILLRQIFALFRLGKGLEIHQKLVVSLGVDVIPLRILIQKLCKPGNQPPIPAYLQILLHEAPLGDLCSFPLQHLQHVGVDVHLPLGCFPGLHVLIGLIILVVLPRIDLLFSQHRLALSGVEGDDLVDKLADHGRPDLGVVDANDDIADVGVAAVVEEVLCVDVDALCGVEIQNRLPVLHVIAEFSCRDQASVELHPGVLHRLGVFVDLRIALEIQPFDGCIRDDLNDIQQMEHLHVGEGENAETAL